jgi:transcriptional regulator with AAA-type ATPase domain
MINYDKQMQALTAIALTAAENQSQSALLFGLPGTGKSAAALK